MVSWFQSLPPIIRKSVGFLPVRVAGLLLQLLASILLARLMGPEKFGAYTYAFVWAAFLGTFLTLGLEQLCVREIPSFIESREFGLLNGFFLLLWGTLFGLAVVIAGGLAGLEATGIVVLAPGWLLVSVLMILHSVGLVLISLLMSLQRINTAQLLEALPRGMILLGLLVALAPALKGADPGRFFVLVIVSSFAAIVLMGYHAIRALREIGPRLERPEFRPWPWYAASIPIALSVFAQLIKDLTDVIMVANMLGDYETGIYRTAARGAYLAAFAVLIAFKVLGPMLSRAVAAGDRQEQQRLLALGALVSTGFGAGACLILGGGATLYLALFGPEFVEGATVLRVLLVGPLLQAVTGATALILFLHHRERLLLAVNLMGLLANVGLNYVFLKMFGYVGAALATTLTSAATSLVLLACVFGMLRLDPTFAATIRLAFDRLRRRRGGVQAPRQ